MVAGSRVLNDEGLSVRIGRSSARVPWAEVEAVVPLTKFGGRRPLGDLVVLRDGSARRVLPRAAAAARDRFGATAQPSTAGLPAPPPAPELPAVSAFPVVEPVLAIATPVFAAAAVVFIMVVTSIGSWAQDRLDTTPAGIVGPLVVLVVATLLLVVAVPELEKMRLAIHADGLELRVRRRQVVLPWSSTERFVWVRQTRRTARVVALVDGMARDVTTPGSSSGAVNVRVARARVAELEAARLGAFAPPRPEHAPRRGLAALCLVAAVPLGALAITNTLATADRAVAIRARAEHVTAQIVGVSSTNQGAFVDYRVTGDPELYSATITDDDAFIVTNGATTVERDPVTGAVWLDAQVRWPPGASDASTGGLLWGVIISLGAPALLAAAWVLGRRARPSSPEQLPRVTEGR